MQILALVLLVGSVSGSATPEVVHPVRWHGGFDLFSYIAAEAQARTVSDIKRQLASPWEYPVEIEGEEGPPKITVGDCGAFFRAEERGVEPRTTVERGAYSSVGLMCIAARVILEGEAAKETHLANLRIDRNIARYLPGEVAYILNTSSPPDVSGKLWIDIDRIHGGEERGDEVKLLDDEAVHFARKVASGDFNGDGLEDLLLEILHAVTEGTHSSEDLYIITRFEKDGPLKVIRKYSVYD